MGLDDCTGGFKDFFGGDAFVRGDPLLQRVYRIQRELGCAAAVVIGDLLDTPREKSLHVRMLT